MPVNSPRAFAATVISTTEIDLTWALCDTPSRLMLVWTNQITSQTASVSLNGATLSYNATGLSPGTTYTFDLTAYGSNVGDQQTVSLDATTDPNPSVAAPSGLTLTTIPYVGNGLSFSFTDNSSNEDDFEFQIIDQGQGDRDKVIIPSHSGTGTVSGQLSSPVMVGGHYYRVRVRARSNTIGVSDWSDYALGGTSPDRAGSTGTFYAPRTPRSPFNFTGVVNSESSVTLSWDSFDTYSAGFYIRVYRYGPYRLWQTYTVPISNHTLSITGLQSATQYDFACVCFSQDGQEAPTGYRVTLTTDSPPPPIPSSPTNCHATAQSTTSARIRGTNTSIYTEVIRVYRTGTSPSVARAQVGTISPYDIATPGYLDTGLTSGNSYKWDLVASNISGDSAASDFSNTLTMPALVEGEPDPQSIEAAALGPDAIFVQWTYGSSTYTSANLDWGTSGSGPWTNIYTGIADGVYNYLHTGLTADTEYFYRLTLVDAIAAETYAYCSATTDSGVAAAPTGPTIVAYFPIGSTRARLEWTPTAANTHAYDIYRALHGGTLVTVDTDLPTTQHTWEDSGLTAATAYDYKVRAKNTAGSGDSSTVTITTTQGAGGPGGFARNGGRTEYARSFNKDTPDTTVIDLTDQIHYVDHFVASAADPTNGPFADLQVDGESISPRDPNTGEARVSDFLIPTGSTITLVFSGTDTTTCNLLLSLRGI